MTEITYPTNQAPRSQVLTLERSTAFQASPYSGQQKVYDFGGAWWTFQLAYPPMRRDKAQAWWAFLVQAKGQVNTFRVPIYGAQEPINGPITSPTFAGAATAGASSFTVNKIDGEGLTAGDYVRIGDYLHVVTADLATAGTSGTLNIEPPLRANVSSGGPVRTRTAAGLSGHFRLRDSAVGWSMDEISTFGFNLNLIEVLD